MNSVDARFSVSSIKHEVMPVKKLISYLYASHKYWIGDAKKQISNLSVDEREKKRIYKLFRNDYVKYRPTFKEWYYSYRFPELSKNQKKEFLSMRDLQAILRKYMILYPEQWSVTAHKERFLEKYSAFIHRQWMLVDSYSDPKTIQRFLDSFDVIAKPTDSESGKGVFKIVKGEDKAKELMKGKLPILLEECVQNDDEIAEFHPTSLNTVRVVTVSNGKIVKLLGAVLRTGNHNSVFDNADAGGYFAEIDTNTGIIISNGVTALGVETEFHPASGKMFKGFRIPRWNKVVEVCKEAALYNPDTTFIAWDIAVTKDVIDIIEGNSIPSIELHQIPLHKGIRARLYSIMDELGLEYRDAMVWANIMGRISFFFTSRLFQCFHSCLAKCRLK